jgi:hypothetical protein
MKIAGGVCVRVEHTERKQRCEKCHGIGDLFHRLIFQRQTTSHQIRHLVTVDARFQSFGHSGMCDPPMCVKIMKESRDRN